jgi:hypothetical protein
MLQVYQLEFEAHYEGINRCNQALNIKITVRQRLQLLHAL